MAKESKKDREKRLKKAVQKKLPAKQIRDLTEKHASGGVFGRRISDDLKKIAPDLTLEEHEYTKNSIYDDAMDLRKKQPATKKEKPTVIIPTHEKKAARVDAEAFKQAILYGTLPEKLYEHGTVDVTSRSGKKLINDIFREIGQYEIREGRLIPSITRKTLGELSDKKRKALLATIIEQVSTRVVSPTEVKRKLREIFPDLPKENIEIGTKEIVQEATRLQKQVSRLKKFEEEIEKKLEKPTPYPLTQDQMNLLEQYSTVKEKFATSAAEAATDTKEEAKREAKKVLDQLNKDARKAIKNIFKGITEKKKRKEAKRRIEVTQVFPKPKTKKETKKIKKPRKRKKKGSATARADFIRKLRDKGKSRNYILEQLREEYIVNKQQVGAYHINIEAGVYDKPPKEKPEKRKQKGKKAKKPEKRKQKGKKAKKPEKRKKEKKAKQPTERLPKPEEYYDDIDKYTHKELLKNRKIGDILAGAQYPNEALEHYTQNAPKDIEGLLKKMGEAKPPEQIELEKARAEDELKAGKDPKKLKAELKKVLEKEGLTGEKLEKENKKIIDFIDKLKSDQDKEFLKRQGISSETLDQIATEQLPYYKTKEEFGDAFLEANPHLKRSDVKKVANLADQRRKEIEIRTKATRRIKIPKLEETKEIPKLELKYTPEEVVEKVVKKGIPLLYKKRKKGLITRIGEEAKYIVKRVEEKLKPKEESSIDLSLETCDYLEGETKGKTLQSIKKAREYFEDLKDQRSVAEAKYATGAIKEKKYNKTIRNLEKQAKNKFKTLGKIEEIEKAEKIAEERAEAVSAEPGRLKRAGKWVWEHKGNIADKVEDVAEGIKGGIEDFFGESIEYMKKKRARRPYIFIFLFFIVALFIFSISKPSTTAFIIFTDKNTLNYKILIGTVLFILAIYMIRKDIKQEDF